MSKPQQTIKKAVSYQGIGLHSGEPVHMVFKPAPEDTGIVFVRTDIEGHPSVRAPVSYTHLLINGMMMIALVSVMIKMRVKVQTGIMVPITSHLTTM